MFQPGQRLRILAGAFTGMDGVMLTPEEVRRFNFGASGPEEATQRQVWLSVRVFGRDVPVLLEHEQVSPADA